MSIPLRPSWVLVAAALVSNDATVLVVERMKKAKRSPLAIPGSRIHNHRFLLLNYNRRLHNNAGFVPRFVTFCAGLAGKDAANNQPSQCALFAIAPGESRRSHCQTNQPCYKCLFHLCSLTYVYSVTDIRFNVNPQVP